MTDLAKKKSFLRVVVEWLEHTKEFLGGSGSGSGRLLGLLSSIWTPTFDSTHPFRRSYLPVCLVLLIIGRPRLLLGTLYVTIVPGPSSLHVRDIFFLDLALFQLLLRVENGQ